MFAMHCGQWIIDNFRCANLCWKLYHSSFVAQNISKSTLADDSQQTGHVSRTSCLYSVTVTYFPDTILTYVDRHYFNILG